MKLLNNKGITLVELTVSVGLMSVLAIAIYNTLRYFDRQEKIQMEDVQNIILKYGGSRVLQNDISASAPGFNYLRIEDENNRPFYVLPTNDYCKHNNCFRKIEMTIPEGSNISEPFFLLVTDSLPDEHSKFEIEPSKVFTPATTPPTPITYIGINPAPLDPAKSISKSNVSYSPWEKNRLVLLSSSNLFYDCNNLTMQSSLTSPCPKRCVENVDCNYSATRQLKFLGKVKNDETELEAVSVVSRPNLLSKDFELCRSISDGPCISFGNIQINSSADLFSNLPYQVGSANLTTITPVKLIRYHLQKPSASDGDEKSVLMRSTATINDTGNLSFEAAHILMSGIKAVEFTRPNISNATIEFKIIRSSLQRDIQ